MGGVVGSGGCAAEGVQCVCDVGGQVVKVGFWGWERNELVRNWCRSKYILQYWSRFNKSHQTDDHPAPQR